MGNRITAREKRKDFMTLLDRVKDSSDHDIFHTPPYATQILVPFLKKKGIKRIWEPACGAGIMTDTLRENGFEVFQSDINRYIDDAVEFDFLSRVEYPPIRRFKFDAIVTNPPYSIKDDFIERCFELGKPFALFLPLTSLGGGKRVSMYKRYGVEAIIPDKRTNFIYSENKKANWFHNFWLCHNIIMDSELVFVEMEK